MEPWMLALFIKPFAAVAVLFGLYCCRRAFARFMPDSKFKNLLLRPLFKSQQSRNG